MIQNPTYKELELRIKALEKESLKSEETEQVNRTARRNYKRFLKFLPYPVLVRDAKWQITYLNPAFTKTFGWTLEELKGEEGGKYIPDFLSPSLRL